MAHLARRFSLWRALLHVLTGAIIAGVVPISAQPGVRDADRPLIGAIRWDAWTDWDLYPNSLAPQQWHCRLPFYAKVLSDTQVQVRGDSQEVMDREIAYARAAGIDYWAWCWYDPQHEDATEHHMNRCLDLYRASAHRSDVSYCLIGPGYWATRHWPDTVALFVSMFKEPNYQKVLGNRPLLYYFMAEVTAPHFGSVAEARKALGLLREKTIEAGLGSPYIVALSFWPDKGAQAFDDVGFDAIGSYCNPGDAKGRELPYESLAGLNRWFWNECRETGKPFIPTINAGWDYRPLIGPQFPDRDPDADWYTAPSPTELADHLRAAIDWTHQNRSICVADTILIYAWNEFAEGGWICPTLSEGTARLDAIRAVLAPGEP